MRGVQREPPVLALTGNVKSALISLGLTLNRSGYYTELWGFPVSYSNSDSDSSSGNSSDCVIISPSS
ncbi:hypothetical protein A2U01_0072500, partial [Trifolium medium]|nr:hypothetical protein [Trifolium medium]